MTKQFHHAALGGTFDHFHKGHERIIDYAHTQAEHMTIGITADSMTKDKDFGRWIEPYQKRIQTLLKYLKEHGYLATTHVVKLTDPYGPTTIKSDIDCLVLTTDTLSNGLKINTIRAEKKLKPLPILEVPLLKGSDDKVIRSSRIRAGYINRSGFPYQSLFETDLIMPHALRNKLRTPLQKPFLSTNPHLSAEILATKTHEEFPPLFITVGDIVSSTFKETAFVPHIMIVDLKTKRKHITNSVFSSDLKYENQPGTISKSAVYGIAKTIQTYYETKINQTIIIEGEEDLLALPVILLAPLHSIVAYGQPDEGIVRVLVTEQIKAVVEGYLRKFAHSK